MIIPTALSDLLIPFACHLLLAQNWEMNSKKFKVSLVTSDTFKANSFEKDESGASTQYVPSSSKRGKESSKSQTQNGTWKRLRKLLFLRQSPSSSSSFLGTCDLSAVELEGNDMTVREQHSPLVRCVSSSPGFAPFNSNDDSWKGTPPIWRSWIWIGKRKIGRRRRNGRHRGNQADEGSIWRKHDHLRLPRLRSTWQ